MLELLIPLNLQLNSHLVERAWQEPMFHQQLIEQPHSTLEKALNIQLPSGVAYQILTDQDTLFHLVLPYLTDNLDAEKKQVIYQETVQSYDPDWQPSLVALLIKAEDSVFRQALLTDTKGVLREFLGLNIPDVINITMVENTATQRYLILPFNVLNNDKNNKQKHDLEDVNLAFLAGASSSNGGQSCIAPCPPFGGYRKATNKSAFRC